MRFTTCAKLAAAIVVLTACSTPQSADRENATMNTPGQESLPDRSTLSHRWFAPRHVDLDAPAVQVARAYRESDNLYRSTGDLRAAHPGFDGLFRRGLDAHTTPYRRTGTIDDHILDVRSITDRRDRTVTRVVICEDRTGIAEPTGDMWTVRETGSGPIVLVVERVGDPREPASLDPAARVSSPAWNVFDGWKVEDNLGATDATREFFSRDDPEDTHLENLCLFEQPRLRPDVQPGDVLTTAPVVEVPVPGWPTEIRAPG